MGNWFIVDEASISGQHDAAIRRSLVLAFPAEAAGFASTRAWHGSNPSFSVVYEERDGTVLAHAGVVDRMVTAGEAPVRVAGIMNVFTLPAVRGRGFGKEILRRAMDEADARSFDIGMLFCDASLTAYYASLGWRESRGAEAVRVENGLRLPLPEKNAAMVFPLRLSALPGGTVHLGGNDW